MLALVDGQREGMECPYSDIRFKDVIWLQYMLGVSLVPRVLSGTCINNFDIHLNAGTDCIVR